MLTRRKPSLPPDAAAFYATRRGALTADLLADKALPLFPNPMGRRVLGLGFAAPILERWPQVENARWAGTARFDTQITRAPAVGSDGSWRRRDCVTGSNALPFDDLSLDIVVMMHGLELASQTALLRATWKAMTDDGHLVLIVPNRSGIWAHRDSTPFGYGSPFSSSQLDTLLARGLFRTEYATGALWLPPPALRLSRSAARTMDRVAGLCGRIVAGRALAGVHVVIARKNLYAGLPPLQAEARAASIPRQVVETSPS